MFEERLSIATSLDNGIIRVVLDQNGKPISYIAEATISRKGTSLGFRSLSDRHGLVVDSPGCIDPLTAYRAMLISLHLRYITPETLHGCMILGENARRRALGLVTRQAEKPGVMSALESIGAGRLMEVSKARPENLGRLLDETRKAGIPLDLDRIVDEMMLRGLELPEHLQTTIKGYSELLEYGKDVDPSIAADYLCRSRKGRILIPLLTSYEAITRNVMALRHRVFRTSTELQDTIEDIGGYYFIGKFREDPDVELILAIKYKTKVLIGPKGNEINDGAIEIYIGIDRERKWIEYFESDERFFTNEKPSPITAPTLNPQVKFRLYNAEHDAILTPGPLGREISSLFNHRLRGVVKSANIYRSSLEQLREVS